MGDSGPPSAGSWPRNWCCREANSCIVFAGVCRRRLPIIILWTFFNEDLFTLNSVVGLRCKRFCAILGNSDSSVNSNHGRRRNSRKQTKGWWKFEHGHWTIWYSGVSYPWFFLAYIWLLCSGIAFHRCYYGTDTSAVSVKALAYMLFSFLTTSRGFCGGRLFVQSFSPWHSHKISRGMFCHIENRERSSTSVQAVKEHSSSLGPLVVPLLRDSLSPGVSFISITLSPILTYTLVHYPIGRRCSESLDWLLAKHRHSCKFWREPLFAWRLPWSD